uniref:Uncharacterized protein n=1 Tax=viral metagenome TaxID=1070528 RepID=A0A6C0BE85_9ZZZZ
MQLVTNIFISCNFINTDGLIIDDIKLTLGAYSIKEINLSPNCYEYEIIVLYEIGTQLDIILSYSTSNSVSYCSKYFEKNFSLRMGLNYQPYFRIEKEIDCFNLC